jgi:hypothetical protein
MQDGMYHAQQMLTNLIERFRDKFVEWLGMADAIVMLSGQIVDLSLRITYLERRIQQLEQITGEIDEELLN